MQSPPSSQPTATIRNTNTQIRSLHLRIWGLKSRWSEMAPRASWRITIAPANCPRMPFRDYHRTESAMCPRMCRCQDGWFGCSMSLWQGGCSAISLVSPLYHLFMEWYDIHAAFVQVFIMNPFKPCRLEKWCGRGSRKWTNDAASWTLARCTSFLFLSLYTLFVILNTSHISIF